MRIRYSLRLLLILVPLFGVLAAVVGKRYHDARVHNRFIAALTNAGATVLLDAAEDGDPARDGQFERSQYVVRCSGIDNRGVLEALASAPSEVALTLIDVSVSRELLEQIVSLPKVTRLRFGRCTFESFAPLAEGGQIQTLTFIGQPIDDSLWSNLPKRVSTVRMWACQVHSLAVGPNESIRWLDLSGSSVDAKAWPQLADFRNLEVLAFHRIRGMNESLAVDEVEAIAKTPTIRVLSIWNQAIPLGTAEALEKVRNLRRIYVSKPDISPELVDHLRQKLPELRIEVVDLSQLPAIQ